jgi:NADPH-dependent curcumin reductase CurA
MDDKPSYIPPIAVGAPIRSGVLGTIEQSQAPGFEVGESVVALGSWSERVVVTPRDIVRRIPPGENLPRSYSLGVLGGTGLTAWFGLGEIGRPRAGETVLVSAAAGGVGSIVVQLALIRGCRVAGIVGSDAKADWLRSLGVAAIQRRTEVLDEAIRTHCPEGVDVYFDSVGGPILEAALRRLNRRGRVVLCGAIESANHGGPTGPRNYMQLLARSARMEGFTTFDFVRRWDEAREALAGHLSAGEITVRETVLDGLDRAPEALGMLFDGGHIGKLLVRLP